MARVLPASLALLLALLGGGIPTAHAQSTAPDRVADGLLVRFRDDVPVDRARRNLSAAGVLPVDHFAPLSLHRCRVPADQDLTNAVRMCRTNPDVVYAEPDYYYSVALVPDDPRLAEQWALRNAENTDIDAEEAWEVQTGQRRIIVAVLDTGLDPTHPDLRDNLWRNPGESGNGRENNRIDDDRNGYVDDVLGWDFVGASGVMHDDNGHGTHVAGTIAARGDNGIGVTGVAWRASILPLRFLDRTGSGRASDAVAAILYAAANGARILNASWGGPNRSRALEEALQYAQRHKVLVVAAAGNLGLDNDQRPTYPAGYDLDNILAVAATDRQDRLAPFSNFGRNHVELAAPGVDILSTGPRDTYRVHSGTSMATPHVTGVAVLVASQFPGLDPRQTMIRLVGGAEPLASLAGVTRSGARLNAYGALSSHPRVAFVSRVPHDKETLLGTWVQAEVIDPQPLPKVALHYAVNGGTDVIVDMHRVVADVYRGVIPAQSPGTWIAYSVRAVDSDGNTGLSSLRRFRQGDP